MGTYQLYLLAQTLHINLWIQDYPPFGLNMSADGGTGVEEWWATRHSPCECFCARVEYGLCERCPPLLSIISLPEPIHGLSLLSVKVQNAQKII